MERVLRKFKPMMNNHDDDLKLIQALNPEAARSFIGDMQKEQDQRKTEDWINNIANENKKVIVLLKCGDEVAIACGILSDITTSLGESVTNITQEIQELSTSFEIEVKPNMAESIEKLKEINIIEDFKPQKIEKLKYSQPPYRERLHSKNVVVFRRCRIRNRPNSGHGFKK